jgi:thiamine biosynthesis lipoprotein
MSVAMQDRLLFATAAMGTRFEIVIVGHESAGLRAIGELAISEIEVLHAKLSYYATDSLLSHINRTAAGSAVRVDADTFELLQDATAVWRASDGAFDITRGSGMDAVVLDPSKRTVRFARGGVSLDLGGIAKGHAVDRATAILSEHGVACALVHGGTSSISAIGAPDGEQGWGIAIAPSHTHSVFLCDRTLSVSSGALRPHIVDPASGSFIRGPRVAVVIGPSARLGDAWSTAAAVLGKRPAGMGTEWQLIIE